ncbi:FkbM family methyltransferase [Thermomonospora umbrina]|uniref:FkbM family methyltransferase n=1 Tax=Thermomonospora umbrina TaxID=111806 RepID=A0A3D9SM48_9ACTN|nr:FkbM family methyltransferase [Thermomonospora umbrina]REE96807.1 FkbM family methyltransferase [Thermomonospora umbrina]
MAVKDKRATADKELGLYNINPWEASGLGEEVEQYFQHGITLEPGATVIDLGANIGVFSAHVHRMLNGDMRGFACEPLPPIYATLEKNARERLGGKVTALPYGVSSRDEELEFNYFPKFTVLSSMYRGNRSLAEEKEYMTTVVTDFIKGGHGGRPLIRRLPRFVIRWGVDFRMRALGNMQKHRVRVRPLSDIIDEHDIDRIDLLKIDVEGAETEVLRGIEERHWPLIRQAVLEVEGWAANHAIVEEFFTSHGFKVIAEEAPVESADIGMVFAFAQSPAA